MWFVHIIRTHSVLPSLQNQCIISCNVRPWKTRSIHAIVVSHTACKAGFQRNPRSHGCFFFKCCKYHYLLSYQVPQVHSTAEGGPQIRRTSMHLIIDCSCRCCCTTASLQFGRYDIDIHACTHSSCATRNTQANALSLVYLLFLSSFLF